MVLHRLVASKALQICHIENGLWLRKGLTIDKRPSSSFASFPCIQLKQIFSQYLYNEYIVSIILLSENFPINALCTLQLPYKILIQLHWSVLCVCLVQFAQLMYVTPQCHLPQHTLIFHLETVHHLSYQHIIDIFFQFYVDNCSIKLKAQMN